MGYQILAVLVLVVVAAPAAHAQQLDEFARFSQAIGKQISIVDQGGVTREGILEAATADEVTLRVGEGTRRFPRADIASAERMKDGRRDGFIKGALFGAISTALVVGGYALDGSPIVPILFNTAFYGGVGWLIDAAHTNRERLYRAPAPTPTASLAPSTLKISWRF